MKKIFILIFLLSLILFSFFSINSLAVTLEAIKTPINPTEPFVAPIEGELIILAAIGSIYAASNLKKQN